MQARNQPPEDINFSRLKSDWLRVMMLVGGLVFAMAGFVRYMADTAAILS